jgi:hypothetical protein
VPAQHSIDQESPCRSLEKFVVTCARWHFAARDASRVLASEILLLSLK